jgi:AcrR family transcriptional regulator
VTTRNQLLAAAGELVEKTGPGNLSVREAARRAGVSHNAPYRHFPDRDSLLAALAELGFEELGKAIGGRTGRELGEAYVRFALAQPQRFRLMFATRKAGLMHQRFAQAFGHLGENAEIAAAAAWALVHGLAQLLVERHLEGDEAFVRRVLGAMRFAQRSA